MRAVLRIDPPLLREVFENALRSAGIDVVGSPLDNFALLLAVKERDADVVFLMSSDAGDPLKAPGICSHLLSEFPHIKIVIVSADSYTITEVGVRTLRYDDLSVESIRASLSKLFD
jgi:hypothetical protein